MTDLERRLEVKMKIEGLKSEKRMIQSTDRKLIDVERGIKVDEEIKAEEAKLK